MIEKTEIKEEKVVDSTEETAEPTTSTVVAPITMVEDIFNPKISKVPKGLEGKTILVYGGNRTGKTKQGTNFPNPFYLGFEMGINGISGIPFRGIQRWSDFIRVNKELTNQLTIVKAKALYQTLIFDTVEAAALMCQDFVCQKYGADSIASGNEGFGLWKEYEQEFFRQLNLLSSVGYTLYFISHEGTRKYTDNEGNEYTKLYPTGDKRSIDPVCNLVDIIAYARTNGLDSDGNEILSSLYLTNTKQYHAGSRFDYLTSYIKEFTAKNLENAIIASVVAEEKAGHEVSSFEDYQSDNTIVRKSFKEMKDEVRQYAEKMDSLGRLEEYHAIVAEYLGVGGTASSTTARQEQQVELILSDLKNLNITI